MVRGFIIIATEFVHFEVDVAEEADAEVLSVLKSLAVRLLLLFMKMSAGRCCCKVVVVVVVGVGDEIEFVRLVTSCFFCIIIINCRSIGSSIGSNIGSGHGRKAH